MNAAIVPDLAGAKKFPSKTKRYVLVFTEADLDRSLTETEKVAATVRDMFDGETPVRTMDVAERLGRNYRTVKTHLHRAGKLGNGDPDSEN